METRITEDRARIIANAIDTDGTFCGTPEWLDAHHINRDEFAAFLEAGVKYATMMDEQDRGIPIGAVYADFNFLNHSGKVGQDDEKWTLNASRQFTDKILSVAEHGTVRAMLFPAEFSQLPNEQTSFDWDDETGEIIE